MNEFFEKLTKQKYNELLEKMGYITLFGEKVNKNNIAEIAYATYLFGKSEEVDKHIRFIKTLSLMK
jgi:hypothetical protein